MNHVASRRPSLRISLQIALTAMWMQQGKPNCSSRSVGIEARYCRRIVPVQALEKNQIPVWKMLHLAAGCLYGPAGALHECVMTPAFAPQHPCWSTPSHTNTFIHAHIHTHVCTRLHKLTTVLIYICDNWYQYNIGKLVNYIIMYKLKNNN